MHDGTREGSRAECADGQAAQRQDRKGVVLPVRYRQPSKPGVHCEQVASQGQRADRRNRGQHSGGGTGCRVDHADACDRTHCGGQDLQIPKERPHRTQRDDGYCDADHEHRAGMHDASPAKPSARDCAACAKEAPALVAPMSEEMQQRQPRQANGGLNAHEGHLRGGAGSQPALDVGAVVDGPQPDQNGSAGTQQQDGQPRAHQRQP